MDKKIIFSGGEPDLNFDDILRDPVANRAALFGLVQGLAGSNSIRLSNAAVTVNAGTSASVTAGYIWLNGEILQVDAATVSETLATDLWEFQKAVTYDSAGDKTFNDGTPRQTWQQNRAVLVNVATITGMNAVNARPLVYDSGFLTFDNFATEITAVTYEQIRQKGDQVHLSLRITVGSSIGDGTICELPTGVDVPPEDIKGYGVEVLTAADAIPVFVDVSARTLRFDTGSNAGAWFITMGYSI